MASYVVKVQYEGNLRRLTLGRGDELAFSYDQLKNRTRDLFQLEANVELVLTYVDKDGDVVTMAGDDDVKDALVVQSLNPLRLSVAKLKGNTMPIVKERQMPEIGEKQNEAFDASLSTKPSAEKSDVDVGAVDGSLSTKPSAEKSDADVAGKPTIDDGVAAAPAPNSSPGEPTNAADAANKLNSNDSSATDVAENGESVIHYCVECDICGQTPLSGPRFKSRRKPNYDLCLSCFESSGADLNDYFKIDRRLSFLRLRHPSVGRMMRLSPAFDSRSSCANSCQRDVKCDSPNSAPKSSPPDAGEKVPSAAENSDGDAKRVLHGGVQCDGCGMSPLAGSRFTSRTKFNYDLCLGCFQKSGSNACEFVRIDQPVPPYPMGGRRMMRVGCPYVPTAHIWILNQLAQKEAAKQAAVEGKTTAPAGDADVHGEVVTQAEPAVDSVANATEQNPGENSLKVTPSNKVEEGASGNSEVTSKAEDITAQAPENSSTNSGPEADTGVEKVPAEQSPLSNVSAQNAGVEDVKAKALESDLSRHEEKLAKLGAMGFTDEKLNAEILERNNFDLRKALEDLFSLEEWDPILEDLEEMGFYDSQVNRRLLFKNNGSVKLVVKELVQMHKESEAGKVEKQG